MTVNAKVKAIYATALTKNVNKLSWTYYTFLMFTHILSCIWSKRNPKLIKKHVKHTHTRTHKHTHAHTHTYLCSIHTRWQSPVFSGTVSCLPNVHCVGFSSVWTLEEVPSHQSLHLSASTCSWRLSLWSVHISPLFLWNKSRRDMVSLRR